VVGVLFLLEATFHVVGSSYIANFKVSGVEKIPLLKISAQSWMHPKDVPYHGPMGSYFNRLMTGCGYNNNSANISQWRVTSRMAEYDVLTGVADIAFPIYREWATSPNTLSEEAGGAHFLPVLSSPGSTILWQSTFVPTTLWDIISSPDIMILILTVICLAIIGGIVVWLLDRCTPDSLFPMDYMHGVVNGTYWAIVSMATVGYGDKVPKSRWARVFTIIFLIMGICILALLQSIFISRVTTANSMWVSQMQKAADILNGVKIGVVKNSIEEWRMRALGAQVVAYNSIEEGMDDLTNPNVTLYSFAVDMLSAPVITNSFGKGIVRPSGTIVDSVTYGFVLSNRSANLPALLDGTNLTLPLSECLDLLTRTGPVEFSRLIYFQGNSYLAYQGSQDADDAAVQIASISQSTNLMLLWTPIVTILTCLVAYVLDRYVFNNHIYAISSMVDKRDSKSGDKDGTPLIGRDGGEAIELTDVNSEKIMMDTLKDDDDNGSNTDI